MTGYYVTVRRGHRTGWLFGPILDHAVAQSFVPYIRGLACALDPWCDFDAFGTASITADVLKPGVLNDRCT